MPESEPGAEAESDKAPCFRCNGTGLLCNVCGEPECDCGCEEPDVSECEDCGGTGGSGPA